MSNTVSNGFGSAMTVGVSRLFHQYRKPELKLAQVGQYDWKSIEGPVLIVGPKPFRIEF